MFEPPICWGHISGMGGGGGGGGGLGNIVRLGDSDYDLYILGGVIRAVGLGMLISGEGAGSETDMEDVYIMGGG